ncbi:tetratricopeptide repeat protein [Fodinibius salsisoli]|uniref:Tetratricopeptide repeat protein n=1 Tax=Fodinibius salsisoli TaxID=2820877 RepID=A0ABT3PI28_9BACT|nr:tetratricopeptide repeat protein [Fodinibius salsisoli]MCW9705413.1 tetratricopeptide repeat protein [Fodinibius salsisoli]
MRYLLITTLSVFLLMGASIEDARKANEAYEHGNYEKAISLYKKAIDAEPKNPKLYYNLASAQAKAGQSEQAIRTFEQFKSMSDDAERKAMSDYNIGNILSKAKKWDQAVDYYKKSLRYIANDEDAKHNYELAKQKQQEQKKKQQKNKNQQNQQDKKNQDQQDQKQQNKQDQQQKKQNQDQQKQQQQQQNQQQKQQNQQEQQQQRKSKISKAEAEKILKALEQKEKNLLKEFKKQKMESSKSKNEKDW